MNFRTTFTLLMAAVATGIFGVSVPKVSAYYTRDVVVNGGFEADPLGTGWAVNTSNSIIGAWSGTSWHGGSRGIKLGYYSMSVVDAYTLQEYVYPISTISIPANASSATFSSWFNIESEEVYTAVDTLGIMVINAADASQRFCDLWYDAALVTNYVWTQSSCDLSAAKGKTVTILIKLVTDKTDRTYANVDDVGIVIDYPDVTAPTTTQSTAGSSTNGFYPTSPSITLTGADDAGGSGLQQIVYGWDAPGTTVYTGPITAPKGKHTLYYSSQDNAGNIETTKTKVFDVAPTPKISTITLAKPQNSLTITVQGKKVNLRPFTTPGNIWARKIDYGKKLGVVYIFGTADRVNQGGVVMYDANGKILTSFAPFGPGTSPEMKYQMVIQKSNDMIFLVITSRDDASKVRTFSVTRKSIKNIGTLKTGLKVKSGQIVSQYLKLYSGDYGLVTALSGRPSTIRVWKYDSEAKRFTQDLAIDPSVIKLSGSKITLR